MRASRSYFPIPKAHAAHRSMPSTLAGVAIIVSFPALLFVPGMPSLLSIDRASAVAVALAWLVLLATASAAYRIFGLSRLYLAFDLVESLGIELGIWLLVYRSGSAVHFLWLAYFAHVQLAASVGLNRWNLSIVVAGPWGLALAFGLKGEPGGAWLSLFVGAMGAYLYNVTARMYSNAEQTRTGQSRPEEALARLCVEEERTRIARDLHDRVCSELAALAWRLRRPAVVIGGNDSRAIETELHRLGERIRGALTSLRNVVLDLRREQRTCAEMLAGLGELCQDLCEGRKLVFESDHTFCERVPISMTDDLQCIILELVRNSVSHADAAQIEVRLRVRDCIELSVADDGCGLRPEHKHRAFGGLANVRVRVQGLGGKLDIQSARPGTRVAISLPVFDSS